MLQWLEMARSVFYYHRSHMTDSDGYDSIRTKIKTAYEDSHKRYGYRRICFELRNKGVLINHKTVRKLMLQLGLKAIRKKKHYNSYKGEVGRVASNEINRYFNADSPNQKWTTDVTQMEVCGTKIYLSPILDMFNGEIISYTISESPNMKMIKSMLDKAFRKHKELNGLIMHSDQGWQYQHAMYQSALKKHDITQSMSRKANCLDNAMMENFFGLMKNELLYINEFKTADDFKRELRIYIQWYNNKRIKLRLNGMSPVQYRAHYIENNS